MKKNSWKLKLLLLAMFVGILACQTVTGVPESESGADETARQAETVVSPTKVSEARSTESGVGQESVPPLAWDKPEDCLTGEAYHAESQLCYRDDGSAEPLFLSRMDGVLDYAEDEYPEELLDDEYVLVKYQVTGNQIASPEYEDVTADLRPLQQDVETQQRIWRYYAAMIPQEARSFLSDYIVTTDGLGGGLAAVEQSPDDFAEWMLNVDIADAENLEELTFTLIHEYGHLLTLNASQVEINEFVFAHPDDEDAYYAAVENCETYFTGEGCALPSSYFYRFYDEFWQDIYAEWDELQYIEDDDEYYDAMDEFYFAHEDQFVTDYAVTNPGEDIAESWAVFVTQPKPSGETIAEKKVLFFYRFPELVTLRNEIIARSYSRMIRMEE
jgi:hypothetical protein